jgi:hypothetical protein
VGAQRERVWRLYMLGSALGFQDGDVTGYQVLATRRDAPPPLPPLRSQLLGEQGCEGGRVHRRPGGLPYGALTG